jgi:F0F1-type ATP synthase assembly protein I
MGWNGENSVEIRHEQEERRLERLAREMDAEEARREEEQENDSARREEEEEAVQTCACGSTEFANIGDIMVCRHCRRSWGPK